MVFCVLEFERWKRACLGWVRSNAVMSLSSWIVTRQMGNKEDSVVGETVQAKRRKKKKKKTCRQTGTRRMSGWMGDMDASRSKIAIRMVETKNQTRNPASSSFYIPAPTRTSISIHPSFTRAYVRAPPCSFVLPVSALEVVIRHCLPIGLPLLLPCHLRHGSDNPVSPIVSYLLYP